MPIKYLALVLAGAAVASTGCDRGIRLLEPTPTDTIITEVLTGTVAPPVGGVFQRGPDASRRDRAEQRDDGTGGGHGDEWGLRVSGDRVLDDPSRNIAAPERDPASGHLLRRSVGCNRADGPRCVLSDRHAPVTVRGIPPHRGHVSTS